MATYLVERFVNVADIASEEFDMPKRTVLDLIFEAWEYRLIGVSNLLLIIKKSLQAFVEDAVDTFARAARTWWILIGHVTFDLVHGLATNWPLDLVRSLEPFASDKQYTR
jgi:hypothetical protein